jgi:integrase
MSGGSLREYGALTLARRAFQLLTGERNLLDSATSAGFGCADPPSSKPKKLAVAVSDYNMRTLALVQVTFVDAAKLWLESRKPYLAKSTYGEYERHINTLGKFFGEMRLPEINADEVRAFQRMRMARAGASIINRECSVLQQMLKRVGCWTDIEPHYAPLPLPKESPHRALTPQEEARLYRVGATNPKWEVAYCAFVISINTTCGPGEIRHLRHMDIDHDHQAMRVQPEGAKNEHRIRVIPLNTTAWNALLYLAERAKKLGSVEPHHYVIPFRVKKGKYDPDRPAKGWRYALNEIRARADLRISGYSFRHHAITKLLENPDVSEETAEAIAGHISHRMKKRYSHTRLEVKRAAVEALERIAPQSVKVCEYPGKRQAQSGLTD